VLPGAFDEVELEKISIEQVQPFSSLNIPKS